MRESTPEVIKATLEVLTTLDPKMLAPCHCSGFRAQKLFSDHLEGFELFRMGYASTISTALLLLSLVFVILYLRLILRRR